MTTCKMVRDGKRYRVDITGHAGFNPGNDPVCAAISALAFTLMQRISDLEAEGAFHTYESDYQSGKVYVEAVAAWYGKPEIESVFKTIITGFELIQAQYPDNLHLEILGWEK